MNKSIFMSISTIVFALVLGGCSGKEYKLFQANKLVEEPTVVDQVTYEQEMSFESIIAPNDRIDITVYIQAGEGTQQMTSMLTAREVSNATIQENLGLLVTQKGNVRLPLIGSLNIAGLTQDEASEYLIKEYKKFIRNPYVIVEIKNQRIIVIGEVNTPGVVPVTNGTMNVLEAIARSGDITDLASRTDIKVIRGDLRNPEIRSIDITSLDALAMSSLYLKPNDIVYVQPKPIKGFNRAFNDVTPLFNMITSVLTPFAITKTLAE